MKGFWKVVALTVLLVFPFVTDAVFIGPVDTSVLQGQTATLQCSNDAFVSGVRLWSEGPTAFANQDGIFTGPALAKYQDFQISSPSLTQIDLVIPNAVVADEGSYGCQITPDTKIAVFKVEIQGNTPTITLDGDSSGNLIILTEDVESILRCTATGYRPAVNLEWYKNNVNIIAGVTEDLPTGSGDTFETSGTLTMTPTKDDDGASLECRTTGQLVASQQTGLLNLNVQYKPVVTVEYKFSTNTISCSADANPVTSIQYVIYLNDTAQNPGQTVEYNNNENGCTSVRCNVTTSIGTGTAELASDLCPGATTTPTTSTEPSTTKKDGNGNDKPTNGAVIAVAVIVPIVVVIIIILVFICYKQKKICFAPSKTGSGGTIPKKQPSASNADMIRNQPEVRQSVHKYDDEPKKPRIPRSSTGNSKKQPVNDAPRQSGGSPDDHPRGYPADNPDGRDQESGGQGSVNYADLEFKNRQGGTNGGGQIHYPEEQTQYASILV